VNKTDPRPLCVECGRRWVPPEGVDATVTPCLACPRGLARLETDLKYLLERGSRPTHHCMDGCSLCEPRAYAAYARLYQAIVHGREPDAPRADQPAATETAPNPHRGAPFETAFTPEELAEIKKQTGLEPIPENPGWWSREAEPQGAPPKFCPAGAGSFDNVHVCALPYAHDGDCDFTRVRAKGAPQKPEGS
jgi:hypothetical protein